MTVLQEFDYVTPIILDEEELHEDWLRSDVMKTFGMFDQYDKVINLADRGPHPTAQQPHENFEQCKYRLAEVPFEEKHNLQWTRDKSREEEIYKKYVKNEEYVFVHNTSSHKERADLPQNIEKPLVICEAPEGYNIFDWYKVITGASQIYCTESSIWAFIDGCVHDTPEDRYLLSRQGLKNGDHYTTSTNWKKDHLR